MSAISSVTFTKRITTGDYEFEEVTVVGDNILAVKQAAFDALATKVSATIESAKAGKAQDAKAAAKAEPASDSRATRVSTAKLKAFKDETGETDDEQAKEFLRAANLDVSTAVANWNDEQAESVEDPDVDDALDDLDSQLDKAVDKDDDLDDLIGGDEPEEVEPVSNEEIAAFIKEQAKRLGEGAGPAIRGVLGAFKAAKATSIESDADRHAFMAKVKALKAG